MSRWDRAVGAACGDEREFRYDGARVEPGDAGPVSDGVVVVALSVVRDVGEAANCVQSHDRKTTHGYYADVSLEPDGTP